MCAGRFLPCEAAITFRQGGLYLLLPLADSGSGRIEVGEVRTQAGDGGGAGALDAARRDTVLRARDTPGLSLGAIN